MYKDPIELQIDQTEKAIYLTKNNSNNNSSNKNDDNSNNDNKHDVQNKEKILKAGRGKSQIIYKNRLVTFAKGFSKEKVKAG